MLKFQDDYTTLIATFEDFILLVYTIINDLYQQFAPDCVSQRRNVGTAKMSDSEIITLSICGELIGMDSENAWYSFVKRNYRHLFPSLCCRTRFNRTRRALLQVTELPRQKLAHSFPMPASRYFVIDSFPLPVCKFGRARYCRSFRADGASYGKCPSKKETYFGFKVHALITLEGYITAFEVPPGIRGRPWGAPRPCGGPLWPDNPWGQRLCRGSPFWWNAQERDMPDVTEAFPL